MERAKKIFAVKREIEQAGKKSSEISCYISSKNASAEETIIIYKKALADKIISLVIGYEFRGR